MQALEKRITALEQSSPTDNMEPMFIHFVGFGNEDRSIERILQGVQAWQRQPDESEQDLKDRALCEVTPPLPRCKTVFLCW